MNDEPETPRDHSPGVCSQFYPALAVSMMVLAFFPLLEPVKYGTLFEMAARQGGGTAAAGIVLVAALIGLMVTATVWVPSRILPLGIAAAAALIVLMLLTKVGTGISDPDLSGSGHAVVALVQVADLSRRRAAAARAER